jgi:hypothetical protein
MANKRVGIQSSAQDNFLEPSAVTGLTATAVNGGDSGNGSVNLTWSLPAASPPATLYAITSTPATTQQSTTSTSFSFPGLAGGVSYTFTVVASNAAGNSQPATSNSATPTTKPNAPSAPTASSPNANQDVVTWSAPSDLGGTANTGYTVKSSDGPTYDYGAGVTSATINETAGTSQTYQVLAKNANGSGPYSASSNSVSTTAPFFPPFFPFFPPFFPFFPFFPPYFPPYFPFFPFFPPYFPPFFPFFPFFPPYFPPYFPFFPFFPPFFPPGFGPFFPPGFGPFFPPSFGPYFPYFKAPKGYCIDGETVIQTTNGPKMVKDLAVGDKVYSVNESDFMSGENFVDSLAETVEICEVEVTTPGEGPFAISESEGGLWTYQKPVVSFNDDETKLSITQPIFIQSAEHGLTTVAAGEVVVGDKVVTVTPEGNTSEMIVETIKTFEESERTVYDVRTNTNKWFILGNYIVLG